MAISIPWYSRWLNKSHTGAGRVGLAVGPDGLAIVMVNTLGAVQYCQFHDPEGDSSQLLANIVAEKGWEKMPCSLVLHPVYYQLLLTEKPPVESDEMSSAGAESVAREIISARALMAAESGAQRKLNEIFPPGGATDTSRCVADTPYTFGGIEGCSNTSVSVACQFAVVDSVNYFTVNSTGRCGPLSEQAVRIVEVQAKDGF